MAYGTVTFFSNVIGQDMSVDYILPDTRRRTKEWKDWTGKKLPAIWILHGNGDSNNAWIRKSNIELYARQFDVAIFMPACTREFYTDSKRGLNYFTYVTEELPLVMRNYFPISHEKKDNFIMGNSMGGYGALKCMLTYPQRYAAAASFSGCASVADIMETPANARGDMQENLKHIFGSKEEFVSSKNNIYQLIDGLEVSEPVRLYLCCGMEDGLYSQNQAFEQYLKKHGEKKVRATFSYGHGGHDWFYWNPEIENVFNFFGFDCEHCWDDSGIVRNKK